MVYLFFEGVLMYSVLDIIKLRKSVRAYEKDKNISDKDLNTILEGARFSQSAKNIQDWKLLVVKERETFRQLVPACKDQSFIADASCVIAACSADTDYLMTCGQPAYTVDVSIAVSNMSLVAAELGIGSCWLGAFFEDRVKEVLGIPSKVRVVAILVLGYPAGKKLSEVVTTTRKDVKEIVSYDKWGF